MKVNFILQNFFRPYSCDELIRLGRNNDGGYLAEKISVLSADALLSYGIDHDWSFEEDFKNYNDCVIHTYDGSIGPKFFIKKLKMRIIGTLKSPSKKYFQESKYWLKLPIRFYKFFKIIKTNKGPNHYEKFIGREHNKVSLINTLSNLPMNKKNIFLKIDIEGSEYEILNEIIESSSLFTGLIIEFHSVQKNIEFIENFIKYFNLKLIHIHINNYGMLENENQPSVLELSFSKFCKPHKVNTLLPNKLDQSNDRNSWDYTLDFENSP